MHSQCEYVKFPMTSSVRFESNWLLALIHEYQTTTVSLQVQSLPSNEAFYSVQLSGVLKDITCMVILK